MAATLSRSGGDSDQKSRGKGRQLATTVRTIQFFRAM